MSKKISREIVKKFERNLIEKYGKIPTALWGKDLVKMFRDFGLPNFYSVSFEYLDLFKKIALKSTRKRLLVLLHDDLTETAHRMINVMIKGTYAQPHMHTDRNTSEEFVVIEGSAAVVTFFGNGKIRRIICFGKGFNTNLVEIKPNIIHTILPITKSVVLFEVKGQTNYDATRDKSFYSWAPKEGVAEDLVKEYLDKLYRLILN